MVSQCRDQTNFSSSAVPSTCDLAQDENFIQQSITRSAALQRMLIINSLACEINVPEREETLLALYNLSKHYFVPRKIFRHLQYHLLRELRELGAIDRRRIYIFAKQSSNSVANMPPALLTAMDSTTHIHLIVGSNPLAGSRCAKSLEVGAKPILVAPETPNVHYGLLKRIEEHGIQWLKRGFQDDDLNNSGQRGGGTMSLMPSS